MLKYFLILPTYDNLRDYKGYSFESYKIAFKHPATFCKMSFLTNRKYLGVDISEEYIAIAKARIAGIKK